jgi:hypothetical protein
MNDRRSFLPALPYRYVDLMLTQPNLTEQNGKSGGVPHGIQINDSDIRTLQENKIKLKLI